MESMKNVGFATQTPSSQQVFGAAFRLQSLEIQNCHTVTSPDSHWVVLEPHQAHPDYHQTYPHHHRTRAGPNNSMVSSFFLIYFEHWHMHGLEALWAQYLLKFHGVYLKLFHSKHQHSFAEKWWYGNAMGCLALPRWFLFKPASNMGRWTNNCNFGRIISFQNFRNTAHFELSQLRGCKYMQAIYNT